MRKNAAFGPLMGKTCQTLIGLLVIATGCGGPNHSQERGQEPTLAELASALTTCPGPTQLVVGYDFDYGAKTGIAPASPGGSCTAGATSAPAGDDYCAGNTTDNSNGDYVIRTADAGTATLKYRFPTGSKQENYTIIVDIPAVGEPGYTAGSAARNAGDPVAIWTGLPSHCTGEGSGITNDGRRLTCNVGTVDATGGAVIIAVPAPFKVSPQSLNGEKFALQYIEKSTGGAGGACAGTDIRAAQALTVSGKPNIDLRVSIAAWIPTNKNGVRGYRAQFFVIADSSSPGIHVGGERIVEPLAFNAVLSANLPLTGVTFERVGPYAGVDSLLTSSASAGTPVGPTTPVPLRLISNIGVPYVIG